MTRQILRFSGSCPSWRVMFVAELKGFDYEAVTLDNSKKQHKTAEHLALNPRGRVPVLRDGDFVLYESMAIVAYLDKKYPDPPVLGTTPEETAAIWRMWSECVNYTEPVVDRLCIPIYRGVAAEKADEVRAASRDLMAELAPYEQILGRTPWLAGDRPTAADAAFVPMLGHMYRAASKPVSRDLDLEIANADERLPNFAAWWKRCQAVPNWDRTYPPHWK
ncbi:MAG TPA: glutathione S-transferase family protein [Kofleriaceae bacterium]|jgi:glutathione S-transferase|nr:glutathione S-transferase family protein [Kofleriaceae bacterium]